ncbi:MAG: hypothetical protein OEU26_34635, partial [Candidatus Tectomicrobia bacterium]|nr:hypothetical protein [Candidatus Tectomicrobia bacterium]
GPIADETIASHYLTVTSLSLALATIGAIFFGPLRLISVPLTLYSALPIFERVWGGILFEGGRNRGIVQSVLIVATLATRYYSLAALTAWLHYYFTIIGYRIRYFNELVSVGLEHDYRQFMAQFYGGKPQSVWVMAHGIGMEVPFDQLRVGDIVMVKAGEVVPVEGTVVEGTANVNLLMATGQARQVDVKEGDRLIPSTIIISGSICMRVDRL